MPHLILIVDDRADDVLLTEMGLSMLGCEIRTESVTNGEQALEFLRKAAELPALILLDLKMPGISGVETLRRLREDKRLNHIPVVIVSCSTHENDRRAVHEAGATAFIHKAIRLNEFRQNLKHHVGRILKNCADPSARSSS